MESTTNNQNGSSLQDATDSHVFKTMNFIKFLRWSHLLKCAGAETLCEFGCLSGELIELRYRNKVPPSKFLGLCNDEKVAIEIKNAWSQLPWLDISTATLSDGGDDYSAFSTIEADAVVALNLPSTISSVDFLHYIQNFYMCGHQEATYTILLPKSTDLLSEQEIVSIVNTYFDVIKKYGVDGSMENFKPVMNEWQAGMYEGLKAYYSDEMLSACMSPFFPDQCPQHLWKLKRKKQ